MSTYKPFHKKYAQSLKGKANFKKHTNKKYILKSRMIIDAKNRPCTDCHGWFDSWQMDFDHVSSEKKLFNVGAGRARGFSLLRTEIAKCEVVCANCHRTRTYKRQSHKLCSSKILNL